MWKPIIVSLILCCAVACKDKGKDQPAAQPETTQEAKPEVKTEEQLAAEKAAEEKRARIEKNTKTRQADEEAAKKELERWTDELHAQAKALTEKKYRGAKQALQAIVASPHRTPGHAERDAHRHPVETLTFLGIQPGMTVVETGAGRGWYTEILAPLLARQGQLVVLSRDPEGPMDVGGTLYALRLQDFLAKSPELYGKVKKQIIDPPATLSMGEPGSADMVLAFREMHNWQRSGHIDAWLKATHEVLKPGGVFGVVQHRAKADANAEDSVDKGYLPEKWVIEKVEAAGFELADRSEINANPKDTKDYEEGVWTLPPALRLGDQDREKYQAIGESDRMTLKFVKVEAKADAKADNKSGGGAAGQ
jgi:predicted methyltransferase